MRFLTVITGVEIRDLAKAKIKGTKSQRIRIKVFVEIFSLNLLFSK